MKAIILIIFFSSGISLFGSDNLSRKVPDSSNSKSKMAVLSPNISPLIAVCANRETYLFNSSDHNNNKATGPGRTVAIGILAVEIVMMANDFYIYPSYSFVKGIFESQEFYKGTGWVFGFRKTFSHSAIELGGSYTTFSERYYMGNGTTTYSLTYLHRQGGAHLNYVHQLLYDKTPSCLKLYVGPTINYLEGLGLGGITGTEIRLSERFKFDVRYEFSKRITFAARNMYKTQTNQIQAGIIFNFQKEYLWKK
jgi:hypothetical protein